MKAIVCRPSQFPFRRVLCCPTCKQRRRFAGIEAIWYGATITCCHCGDSWTSGERHERPFRRGWRTESAASARRTWDEAGNYTKGDRDAWLREQLAA